MLAAIALAGDIATLAEVSLETALSPWVIENEVSATYTATVTIARDPRAATFPVTAHAWRLEAIIDGASGLLSTTGTINAGGHIQSDPIVAPVPNVPFGGTTIQWSLVLTDAGGRQVGTGASAKLPNNDAAHPPDAVAFAITELPAPLTAQTPIRARRHHGLGRGGRRPHLVQHGHRPGHPRPERPAGDHGHHRVHAPRAGRLRLEAARPLLRAQRPDRRERQHHRAAGRSDARASPGARFCSTTPSSAPSDGGASNHVLLEPDATSDGYHVRRLVFDPTASTVTWDPDTSWGFFPAPISAAALHAGGRIVTVHADSGRLGLVAPYQVNVGVGGRPALASYKAGPGTQPGLLQSPIAVAITNPGVVLVLEAARQPAGRLRSQRRPAAVLPGRRRLPAAARCGGHVPGPGRRRQRLHLRAVLHGRRHAPERLPHRRLHRGGAPLVTHSPGVNVARLAVDYWRSIYGVNFTALADQGTSVPHVDPALGVLEPSISRFDPVTPAVAARRRRRA